MNTEKCVKEAHNYFVASGEYVCPECGNPIVKCKGAGQCDYDGTECTLKDNCGEFEPKCSTCSGTGIDPNKNIGDLLMRIIEELGAASAAHREGRFADWGNFRKESYAKLGEGDFHAGHICFEQHIKDTREDHIAMAFLRLFDLCGYLGIELTEGIPDGEVVLKEAGNIGEDLYMALLKLPTLNRERNGSDYRWFFHFMISFCQHHNIPVEKHIEHRLAYNRTLLRTHGKKY